MTAVRVTHIPTKITGYADSKSQWSNKKNAMAVVLGRLRQKDSKERTAEIDKIRSEQVRDLGRGTRVRTYNFIRNKVIDENVKKKFRIKDIMDGKLDLIYKGE
jgi:protein subunit release factor A